MSPKINSLRMTERESVASDFSGAPMTGEQVLETLERALHSHIDGRDYLAELNPMHARHIDIVVRINGENRWYEGDWLKALFKARNLVRNRAQSKEEGSQ